MLLVAGVIQTEDKAPIRKVDSEEREGRFVASWYRVGTAAHPTTAALPEIGPRCPHPALGSLAPGNTKVPASPAPPAPP